MIVEDIFDMFDWIVLYVVVLGLCVVFDEIGVFVKVCVNDVLWLRIVFK